ncbi:MAG: hypothetical protein HN842_07420 [Gammaproteobacteria bacterium]|jgi:hypothetical protein|nr:hypothetical protein [Gammaproteobacteria bacterium]MBT7308030.1 hypothetical protein [Gammaproteobacteria bacterium]
MHDRIVHLMRGIVELEQGLQQELEQKQEEFRYHFEKRRILFEQEMVESQRKLKVSVLQRLRKTKIRIILSIPVIYGLLLPLLLVDLSVWLYQWICFSLWGISTVRRREYWLMDREQLAYLNFVEKLNCLYCGYANGLASYIREVASRTEQYWCPIKHAHKIRQPHPRYWHFSDYGDAPAYRKNLQQYRADLR